MQRQRNLLDYATSGSSSSSASAHHRAESADCSDSDSSGEPSQPKRWVSGDVNSVQVHRTQGGTTVIINNSAGSSVNALSPTPSPTLIPSPSPTPSPVIQLAATVNTHASEVPSDVAATLCQQPCQPNLVHFPTTLIGNNGHLVLSGINL